MAAKRNIKAMLKVNENLDSVMTLAGWRFWSDLGENVGNVGFVEGGDPEAFVECCQCENLADTNVASFQFR